MKGTDGMENRFSHLSIPYLAARRPFEEDADGLQTGFAERAFFWQEGTDQCKESR